MEHWGYVSSKKLFPNKAYILMGGRILSKQGLSRR